MIREALLMSSTRTVTIPDLVLPTKVVPSQRKCRFQFCFRGWNKAYQPAFDEPRQIGSLGPVAFGAGQTEVVRIVRAAVLYRDDMLDVKGLEFVFVLMKPAVLAAATGPLPDESSERVVHHSPGDAARSCRALDFKMAMNVA